MTRAWIRRLWFCALVALTTAFLVPWLPAGVANAKAVGTYVAAISPGCAMAKSNVTLTATIKNTSASSSLGSAVLHSSVRNGFSNIQSSSFGTPVVTTSTGGASTKTWTVSRDPNNADGIYLQAASSEDALSPNESVAVTFVARAPSSAGTKTWSTTAWQPIHFPGAHLKLSGANPTVQVGSTCPPASVMFQAQPTDTVIGSCIDSSDCTGGGVKVFVADAYGNPVPGANVVLTIGTDPTGVAALHGGECTSNSCTQSTDASGVATFSDLLLGPTSSGYELEATVTGVAPVESDPFAITNTGPDCGEGGNPLCKATFSNGTGTVTAPPGTVLIIQSQQLDCSSDANPVDDPIAGTVTIIPSGDAPIAVDFDDSVSIPVSPQPFCKTIGTEGETEDVPFCQSVYPNGLDQPGGNEACLDQSVEFNGPDAATLQSVLYMDSADPTAKH